MNYEQQKEIAGRWATFAWIGSGLYLYLSTDGVSLLSWSALGFFLVGMFTAAIIFGIAIYGLQRGITKVLVKSIGRPNRNIAGAIRSLGLALLVMETVLIFLAASWVFHQIEPPHPTVSVEYRVDHANFVAAIMRLSRRPTEFPCPRAVARPGYELAA